MPHLRFHAQIDVGILCMGHIQAFDDQSLLEDALRAIRILRAEGARVHCITNTVAQNFTANILLACGATPSMTVAPSEVHFFTERADALLVNLGTLDDQRMQASRASMQLAVETGKPTVLDPVMCHLSQPRLAFARDLLSLNPSILRANADEAAALNVSAGFHDDLVHVETGSTDQIKSGEMSIAVENGHPWLAQVTAVGCAQGALMAALASKAHPLTAALAALIWTGIAGELAATKSTGPGSFQINLIDALHYVTTPDLESRAKVIMNAPNDDVGTTSPSAPVKETL